MDVQTSNSVSRKESFARLGPTSDLRRALHECLFQETILLKAQVCSLQPRSGVTITYHKARSLDTKLYRSSYIKWNLILSGRRTKRIWLAGVHRCNILHAIRNSDAIPQYISPENLRPTCAVQLMHTHGEMICLQVLHTIWQPDSAFAFHLVTRHDKCVVTVVDLN